VFFFFLFLRAAFANPIFLIVLRQQEETEHHPALSLSKARKKKWSEKHRLKQEEKSGIIPYSISHCLPTAFLPFLGFIFSTFSLSLCVIF